MYFNFILDFLLTILSFAVVAININRYKSDFVFTNTIFIFLFGASIVTLLISYNALLGRLFIYLFYFANIFYFVFNFFKKKEFIFRFLNQCFLFSLFLISIFIIYIYYSINYEFVYNGHDPYFFSIPFEISEAFYTSRLKIFDNFPKTWSKYHFFHGSFYSFFTIFALSKNIFLFKAIKVFTLFVLYKSLNEILCKNKLALFSFFICSVTLFTSQTSWFLYSNGILSLYLLVCCINYVHLGKHYFAIIFILLLANSSVKTFLPALSVLGCYLFIYHKDFKHYKLIKYFVPTLILASVLSMVLSGNINSDYTSLSSFGDTNFNFISSSWFNHLIFYKLSLLLFSKPYMALIASCVSFAFIFFLKLSKRDIFNFMTVVLLISINLLFINFWSNYIWISNLINLLFLSFIIFSNKSLISGSIFRLSLIYILVSCFQLFVIPPDSAIVNIMLLELLLFSFIIYIFIYRFSHLFNKFTFIVMIFLAFVTIFRATYRYADNDTVRLKVSEYDLNKLNKNKIFKYENVGDYKKAVISVSLFGKRVESSEFIQSKYHVSNQFIAD